MEKINNKSHFVKNSDGVTFIDHSKNNILEPGKNASYISVFTNKACFFRGSISELDDEKTMLYGFSDSIEKNGIFESKVKLVTHDKDHYINPELLKEGKSCTNMMLEDERDY